MHANETDRMLLHQYTITRTMIFQVMVFLSKAIYNRLAHIHLPLVDLYSSILCLEEVPIVKCNKSWSSEKLSISINISTEWLAKIHFDIWEYKFYEKDFRCSARN